ncbi:hypothetical protein Y032_0024g1012 [Ancylostoma ceylanicum]|uniref:Uncharacterized protein n=1 Tax=Ancylostoma ceylanicum TaxID=53326 RepID=A0A016UVR8_9BILA|nr:hypothetical protein Y032_0024g1012 [Ancylostoma ceylanicum]
MDVELLRDVRDGLLGVRSRPPLSMSRRNAGVTAIVRTPYFRGFCAGPNAGSGMKKKLRNCTITLLSTYY